MPLTSLYLFSDYSQNEVRELEVVNFDFKATTNDNYNGRFGTSWLYKERLHAPLTYGHKHISLPMML